MDGKDRRSCKISQLTDIPGVTLIMDGGDDGTTRDLRSARCWRNHE